ncbi:MAG: TAXI family TRAP transporter solute-binding subunit [Microbacterium sp.]
MSEPFSPQRTIRFQSDWGGANLTRVAGWLAQWLWESTDGGLRSVIHNGRGMGDNVRALGRGLIDIAIVTPVNVAAMALDGSGPFRDDPPVPMLRGLATLPHRDAMLAVARRDLGLRHLSDAASSAQPLRISMGLGDPNGFMGFAAEAVLDASGIHLDDVLAAGGDILRHESPFAVIDDLLEGRADIAISEAIMTPKWQQLGADGGFTFLGLSDAEERAASERSGLGAIGIPAGRFAGLDHSIRAVDYAGWAVLTTDRLDDEVAELIAEAVCVHAAALERHYRHIPVDGSPLTYPIIAASAARMPLPLHPAAERVYARHSA